MKSFFSKLLFLSIFVSSYSQVQILNGDFEQWSGGEPDYWYIGGTYPQAEES